MADFTTSKTDGQTVGSSEWNQLADFDNLTSTSGQTPSTTNLYQSAIAASRYSSGGQYFTDSGTANAYVLSPVSPFKSPVSSASGEGYFVGMTIRFRAGNPNTGASTVNVNSAGVKNLKRADGSTDLESGDITVTKDSIFRYDGTSFAQVSELADVPMFRAYLSSVQTITPLTITKVQFNSEEFDSHSWYDNSTNYRFTPLRAGKYLVIGRLQYNNSNASERRIYIFKNGISVAEDSRYNASGAENTGGIQSLVSMNGSTDYLEIFTWQNSATNADTYTDSNKTEFSAIFIG